MRRGHGAARRHRAASVKTPVEMEIRFKNYRPAEVLSLAARRARAWTPTPSRYTAADMVEAYRFLEFVLN